MATTPHKSIWQHWYIDLAGALLCSALSVAGYFVALRPLVDSHLAFDRQQDLLAAKRQEASHLVASDFAHKQELASVRSDLAARRIKLKPADRVNRQVAGLTELVSQCGLKTDNIQLGETFVGSRYDRIPISLAGDGEYGKCVQFLHKLCQAYPDTGVGSFQISGNPRNSEEIGTFRFGLFWYAARPGPASGPLSK